MNTKDRRALERFSLDLPALLIMRDGPRDPEQRFETHTRDVSANGAFVYLERSPGMGTRVRVEMQLVIDSLPQLIDVPEQVRLSVEGKVVRRNHQGIGIVFDAQLKFDQPDLDQLYRFEEVKSDE